MHTASWLTFILYAVVLNLYFLVVLFVFLGQRASPIISKRLPIVVFIMAVCSMLLANAQLFSMESFPIDEYFSCRLRLSFTYFVLPVWYTMFVIRMVHLTVTYKLNQLRLGLTRVDLFGAGEVHMVEWALISLFSRVFRFGGTWGGIEAGARRKSVVTMMRHLVQGAPRENLRVLLTIVGGVWAVFGAMYCIILVPSLVVGEPERGSKECDVLLHVPVYAVIGILSPFLLRMVKNVREQNAIRRELLVTFVLSIGVFVSYVLLLWLLPESPADNATMIVWYVGCFSLSATYPAVLALASRRQSRHLNLSLASFQQVLDSPQHFTEFKQIVAQQFCYENVLFYQQYKELFAMSQLGSSSDDFLPLPPSVAPSKESEALLLSIYHDFIKQGAPHQLNLPSSVTAQVAENIRNKNLHPSILTPVYNDVYQMLFQNSFPLYYAKYKHLPMG
jgi:hypothetical protein